MPKHAIVVVDMQAYFCRRDHAFGKFVAALGRTEDLNWFLDRLADKVVPTIAKLQDRARQRHELIVVTEFGSRTTSGSDLPGWARRHNDLARSLIGENIYIPLEDPAARTIAELSEFKPDLLVQRSTSGPLAGTGIVAQLREAGVEQVQVTGVATDVCITNWVRQLADCDFEVTVPEDACATPFQESHDWALRVGIAPFASVLDSASIHRTGVLR